MCEYFRRYDDLAEFLTGLGFAVCGNDHLGHGDSVNGNSELGYFSQNMAGKTLSRICILSQK